MIATTSNLRQKTQAGIAPLTARTAASEQAQAIQRRMAETKDQTQRLSDLATAFKTAAEKGDVKAVELITADYKTASAMAQQIQRDLAAKMLALGGGFKDIGFTIEELQKMNSEEEGVIAAAKELLETCKAKLEVARQEKVKAEAKRWFRAKAIALAEQGITTAKANLESAEAGIKTAEQIAAKMKRERLENASLDDSLQNLQTITTRVVEISKARISEIEANLDAVESGLTDLLDSLKGHATQVAEGDKAIETLQATIATLRTQQDETVANSPEWTELQGQIELKRNELEKAEADRNKAFTLQQDGNRFVEMYRVQQQAQLTALQFHRTWIATLESGVENRAVLFKSDLGAIQAAADNQAMDTVDQIATQTDEDITKGAVARIAAARNAMADKLAKYPGQIKTMRDLTEAEAKSKAQFAKSFDELQKQFADNYGTPAGYDDSTSPQNAA